MTDAARHKYSDAPGRDMADVDEAKYPPLIPNSELQLDADISSFYLAWTDETLAQNIEALKRHIRHKRLMAGCEHVNLHLTRGDKAGRHQASNVVEYQANRKVDDEAKKARVDALRQWMSSYNDDYTTAMPQWYVEADDSMSIRQLEQTRIGRVSKIMTLDKDLDMVDGNHIHYDTYEEWNNIGYGKIWLDTSAKAKKCKGQGTAFFWAQMLMGDKADNIPGLPKITGAHLNEIKPTVAVTNAQTKLRSNKLTPRARASAKKVIDARKDAPIGAVTAYMLLEKATNDAEAMRIVWDAYKRYYGVADFELETWRGITITTNVSERVREQGKLLWMLRAADDSVVKFFQGCEHACN